MAHIWELGAALRGGPRGVDYRDIDRYHVRRAARTAHLSGFERHSLAAGPLLVAAAVVLMMATESVGGWARAAAAVGLATLALCALVRGVRLYRLGAIASMPTSVARVYAAFPETTGPGQSDGTHQNFDFAVRMGHAGVITVMPPVAAGEHTLRFGCADTIGGGGAGVHSQAPGWVEWNSSLTLLLVGSG